MNKELSEYEYIYLTLRDMGVSIENADRCASACKNMTRKQIQCVLYWLHGYTRQEIVDRAKINKLTIDRAISNAKKAMIDARTLDEAT